MQTVVTGAQFSCPAVIWMMYNCALRHFDMFKLSTFCQGWKISWYFRKYLIFRYFQYIYQTFAHTLLKLNEIYYQIIVCVCVHCILGEVLLSFTLHCCGEVQSDRSCPTWENAEGTSHKPAKHTDWKSKRSHNVSRLKIFFLNSIKIENNEDIENIRYFCTKISDIYRIYINDILSAIYTVNHKKGGSTFVIITLENLDRFL